MATTRITLLDGGVGQEINRRAARTLSHPQWSVKVMLEEPELVSQVHREFLQAGCKVMTLNNYAATPTRMKKYGMHADFASTHALAAECMQRAIANSGVARADIQIAGCLPPLAASYVTEAAPPYQQAYAEYCQLIEQQANVADMFLIETMSNLQELRAALDALTHFKRPAYAALTLKDDGTNRLRSGQPLAQALTLLQEYSAQAALINCCYPEAIDTAMPLLAQSGLAFGAYANGFKSVEPLTPGTTVDQLQHRPELTPERYTQHALSWVQQGASIVGGCCEISPTHMAHLHNSLRAQGYQVTAFATGNR